MLIEMINIHPVLNNGSDKDRAFEQTKVKIHTVFSLEYWKVMVDVMI